MPKTSTDLRLGYTIIGIPRPPLPFTLANEKAALFGEKSSYPERVTKEWV